MTRLQSLVVASAAILVLILYFGFDTKSVQEKVDLEKIERTGITIDIQPLIEKSKSKLSSFDLNEIVNLENRVQGGQGEDKINALKELSGRWYRLEQPYIAGSYAEMIAEEQPSGEAWSIAATTFLAGIRAEDDQIRQASLNKAIESFENAISIDPEEIQYRVNLALIYADSPPADNPMKGVQMLLNLNEKYPEDVLVLNALARLAIKTGQWERAKERLEKADSLQPDHPTTTCLLAEVYAQMNDQRADMVKEKCELLTIKK